MPANNDGAFAYVQGKTGSNLHGDEVVNRKGLNYLGVKLKNKRQCFKAQRN